MLLVNITVKTMSSLMSCDMTLSGVVTKGECHEVLGWAQSAGMSGMIKLIRTQNSHFKNNI